MIPRKLTAGISKAARKFAVIAVTGPRQSGKTTLVRSIFPDKPYVSLENIDVREYAMGDPRGFLREHERGVVLDEIQRVPQLFSYLQGMVDKQDRPGTFILTGSQNFLLMEQLSQTLAGRVALFHLMPFDLEELDSVSIVPKTPEEMIFKGCYPRIYDKKIQPAEWYPSYIQTYLERDVRLVKNVDNLNLFARFLKLCASRTGQILNLSSLANDCGITHNTARSWLGVLEGSFVIHLLKPYYRNFKKRLVKSPKLYFFDTGIACSLLNIENKKQVMSHPLKGSLFETFVVGELVKSRLHRGLPPNNYFWRDKTGHEIDCLIEKGPSLLPIEIKSGETITADSFKGLDDWERISGRMGRSFLVYGGTMPQSRGRRLVIGWKDLGRLFETTAQVRLESLAKERDKKATPADFIDIRKR